MNPVSVKQPRCHPEADRRKTPWIFPLRGLVLLQDKKGRFYPILVLKRWIQLNHVLYKALKVDALAVGDVPSLFPELLEYAAHERVKLSLRIDCAVPPRDLPALKTAGLFDVFLCPPSPEAPHLDAWMDGCRAAGLPIRMQLHAPFAKGLDVAALTGRIARAGVTAVNVALHDPFCERPPCRDAVESQTVIDTMNALVSALDANDIEANLIGLPFCLVREENLCRAVNSIQFHMDHQQYIRASYAMAKTLRNRGPILAGMILQSLLWRDTVEFTPQDERLLNWLTHHPALYVRLAFWHKLTRHLRLFRSVPKELDPSPEAYQRELKRVHARTARELGPDCARCRLRRICDHATPAFKRMLPGIPVRPLEGELLVSPLHFSAGQRKYYDAIDADRRDLGSQYLALAEEADLAMRKRPPDRHLTPQDYSVEYTHFVRMEGGMLWYSMLNCEKCSSPLADLTPPFTVSVTFAHGVADYIGFHLDRSCKLVCPMEAFRHEVTLHVAADGRYVLLRDGRPVRPAEFEGAFYMPLRLSDRVQPRISIWNIDGSIVTHLVRIWEWDKEPAERGGVKYSVIVVCTRFARRLQAALLSLAHQREFDLSRLEVIIAYVPGVDAVDDVIDCMRQAYPQLRILRSTFHEQKMRAKGFLINESLRLASGKWIVLMDADALLAPDMFARVEAVEATSHFIAPDGRKMLPAETTARILVGDIRPWEAWDKLLKGPGEYRRREAGGVPVGFCQFVRADCIKTIKYLEVDHFELSDMYFSREMRKRFGPETWLTGVPILHLDHGGSQWYGAQTHR